MDAAAMDSLEQAATGLKRVTLSPVCEDYDSALVSVFF
jgi:hypothetical protein